MAVKLVISGCAGRMGRRIVALALADPAFAVVGGVEAAGNPTITQDVGALAGAGPIGVPVTSDLKATLARGDVLVEFTQPEATLAHLQIARELRKSIVVGTTGLTDEQRQALTAAAKDIAIVFSPNMSVGVNLLFELVRSAAQQLGLRYDVEIVEAHHKAKIDAPSGTAKRLAEMAADGRKQTPAQIPVHAIRAGDIVGDHTVVFAGPFERIELTHRASNRDVFAIGALRAAQFLASQPPGLYDMRHVLQGQGR